MRRKIKNVFLAGFAVAIPIGVTIYILFFLIAIMDSFLAVLPKGWHPDELLGFRMPGLGLIFTLLLIFLVGLVARSWFGGRMVATGERLFNKIPLVRNIYQATKQLVDALFGGKARNFRKVVLIEFPRKGVYTLAFVTGHVAGEPGDKAAAGYLNIFVPTTPNPTSGYYLMVPEEDVIGMDMTVEDAFKMIISGGLVVPKEKEKTKIRSDEKISPEP
jgi:uncharacterized membrane protein